MSSPAHINHKEGYRENPKTTTNRAILNGKLTQRNNHTPHEEVSIEFAASQWFRILLVHINNRNSKLNGAFEPIPSASCGQLIDN